VKALSAVANAQNYIFNDTWWIVAIKVVGVFAILVLITLLTIWAERRVVGRMQHRIGPNRVGPQGLLQSLMDGVKLALKEDIIPTAADVGVYVMAPIISTIAAFLTFAVIPFGPEVSMFGHITPLQLTDFPASVLYIIAISSIGIYGIVLAGWSSGSTYALLGSLRSSAQMISYEIAMGLSFVAVFMWSQSMSTHEIVAGQKGLWYVFILFPSFVIYAIAMVGETNRAPFDLPEAEGELVGGFHTEYSSLKFALFFLAEYINMVTVSALITTLFLGGWRAPWPITGIWSGANSGWWPMLWFIAKIALIIFVFIWLRGTLPRYRYDQFMRFGWKVLIPVSVVWILIIALVGELRRSGNVSATITHAQRIELLIGLGSVMVIVVAVFWAMDVRKEKAELKRLEDDTPAVQADPFAGGHPVPPLPGQSLLEPRPARRQTVAAAPAAAAVTLEMNETPQEGPDA